MSLLCLLSKIPLVEQSLVIGNQRKASARQIIYPIFINTMDFYSIYSCFSVDFNKAKHCLDEVLSDYSKEIWNSFVETDEQPFHFDGLEHDIPRSQKEGIDFIASELWKYIIKTEIVDGKMNFVINCDSEGEACDSDICEQLMKRVFLKSGQDFYLSQQASFQGVSGLSHQEIHYLVNDELVTEDVTSALQRLFKKPTSVSGS